MLEHGTNSPSLRPVSSHPTTLNRVPAFQAGREGDSTMWTLVEAVELCVKLEAIAPKFGAHVALTGGALYKDGLRKDVDIEFVDVAGLMDAISVIGVQPGRDYGWCYKATFNDKPIDFFFPERPDSDGTYPVAEGDQA